MASRKRVLDDPLFHNDSPSGQLESHNLDPESYSDSEDSEERL